MILLFFLSFFFFSLTNLCNFEALDFVFSLTVRLYNFFSMSVSRILFRASRSLHRSSPILYGYQTFPILYRQFHGLVHEISGKSAPVQVSLLNHIVYNPFPFQRFGVSSTAIHESSENEGSAKHSGSTNNGPTKHGNSEVSDRAEESTFTLDSHSTKSKSRRRSRRSVRTAFSDSDSESDEQPSMDDLVKSLARKEELLKSKHKELEKMQDKVLRSYAEMENVMDRTRREAENSKKFAIQNFAKSLLDVADNLGRASSVVKDSFSKINESQDSSGAVPLLKSLLEGVDMTEKQLMEAFTKFGVEKFDPTSEPFDPHKHFAVFQIPDGSKPDGTVAIVLKSGYMLHDRVLRPAEVGVTQAAEDNSTN
ncbi:grpE protein homolog 2, mitochondrial-like [Benincasa hispida]|uniref:grpE protein homolog 2, mitochondrial-like n=1 Tax=Benincasa hispida TaxID=102211 RepID=UPI001901FD78|nr:grpE protein homolog 2, mitochondrial-like [Benincasa hispida]